jgi:hypothetical protein
VVHLASYSAGAEVISGGKQPWCEVDTHFCPVPRLRMSGAIPLLPSCADMAWITTDVPNGVRKGAAAVVQSVGQPINRSAIFIRGKRFIRPPKLPDLPCGPPNEHRGSFPIERAAGA